MHFVYVIFSRSRSRYYVGETEDVAQRLIWHNSHLFKGSATSNAADWQLKKIMVVENRKEARIVEEYIKSMKSSKFLDKLLHHESYFETFKTIVLQKFDIVVQ